MRLAVLGVTITLASYACTGGDDAPEHEPNIVEVIARGLEFEAPDEIPSGWTTFRLKNESGMVHFALLERLPEGRGIEDHQQQVAPIFQEGMELLFAGEFDAAQQKFGTLPEWFSQVVFMGGPGLTAAGATAEASVYVEPGTYLLECYVKTNGVFHAYNPSPSAYGMVHELTVTGDSSAAPEPSATVEITISSERGIEVEGEMLSGEHTVSVRFEDQTVHENFVGHDVHLVRLEDETDLGELGTWMDWSQPGGLETPAPVEFLGGTNEMPAGEIAYFTVRLEAGRYAWVAEVSGPEAKNMLKTFTVQ